MVGYSEVLQTMAAMVLFSLILLQANKIILLNSQQEVESEAEQKAVAIAQEYIKEARALAFDDESTTGPPSKVPEGFSSCKNEESDYADFDDFDDFHEFSEPRDWDPDEDDNAFQVDIQVKYVTSSNYDISDGHTGTPYTLFKKMVVTVTSDYLTDGAGDKVEVKVPYLRRYYKQQ